MEEEFAALLKPLEMDQEKYAEIVTWLESRSEQQVQDEAVTKQRHQTELEEIDARIDELIETISKTRNEVVLRSLEGKVEELSQQRGKVSARLQEVSSEAPIDVGNLLERVGILLKNPLLVWETGDKEIRHLIAKVAFTGSVVYGRETGFGTPELSLPHRVFGMSMGGRSALVDPRRPFSNPGATNHHYSTGKDVGMVGESQDALYEALKELARWDQLLSELLTSRNGNTEPCLQDQK